MKNISWQLQSSTFAQELKETRAFLSQSRKNSRRHKLLLLSNEFSLTEALHHSSWCSTGSLPLLEPPAGLIGGAPSKVLQQWSRWFPGTKFQRPPAEPPPCYCACRTQRRTSFQHVLLLSSNTSLIGQHPSCDPASGQAWTLSVC